MQAISNCPNCGHSLSVQNVYFDQRIFGTFKDQILALQLTPNINEVKCVVCPSCKIPAYVILKKVRYSKCRCNCQYYFIIDIPDDMEVVEVIDDMNKRLHQLPFDSIYEFNCDYVFTRAMGFPAPYLHCHRNIVLVRRK